MPKLKNKYALRTLTLKQKCLYTILLLIACRMLCSIPTPFVEKSYFQMMIGANGSFSLLNAMTGNGLYNLSIMALGVTPYITASIILQLMGVLIPRLEELRKGMIEDRKKLENYTIILGCVLSLLEGLSIGFGYGKTGLLTPYKWYVLLIVAVVWMLGTLTASLVGKYITEHFIGNGISMILAVNIMSSFPADVRTLFERLTRDQSIAVSIVIGVVLAVAIYFVFMFVALVQGSEKRLTIQYSGKVDMNNIGKSTTTMPIKLCPGSVVPVIFASSILTMPNLVLAAMGKDYEWMSYLNTNSWFRTDNMKYSLGAIVYVVLIFFFTYYYANMEFNTREIAEQIQKSGGVIPGIRPGKPTSDYLTRQMKYTLFLGAIALSVVAIVPTVVAGVLRIGRISFLGTSVIIVVGVILETKKAIQTEHTSTSYVGSIEKGGALG